MASSLMPSWRHGAPFLAAAVCVGVLVHLGVGWAVKHVAERDGVVQAERWADHLVARVPRLETLIITGAPDPKQTQVIRDLRALGDVFRFKLFDATGRLALLSDDSALSSPPGLAPSDDPEPARVLATGAPIVAVLDGRAKPDRPDVYAEAYVPVTARDGAVIGVVEVYVDLTQTQRFFAANFRRFGVVIAIACTLAVFIPTLAFLRQRQTAQKAQNAAAYLAQFDPLTGLLNRREFVARVGARGAAPLAALAFLDVDRFKQINDTHGHGVGDALLTHVAHTLSRHASAHDLAARFGGDEFVLGLRARTPRQIESLIESIRQACGETIHRHGAALQAGVSIGVAHAQPGVDLSGLLSRADAALYAAKEAGRDQYAVYSDRIGATQRRRTAIEARIRAALRDDGFTLHYQPLVSASCGRIVGYEGLLRLADEDGSPIPPAAFVPVAEAIGVIPELGRWVIETGLRDLSAWPEPLSLSLNLSALQFDRGDLPLLVTQALDRTGVAASRLELEITESLLLSESAEVQMQLDHLQDIGVALSLDDFGTGFSSLNYLWRYGFDKLKIDRSFITALDHSPERASDIIETIIMLSRRLGMAVTAEGIETEAQARRLREMGCDILQGYHFGRPAPNPMPQRRRLAQHGRGGAT